MIVLWYRHAWRGWNKTSPPRFITLWTIRRPSYKAMVAPNIYITTCYILERWKVRQNMDRWKDNIVASHTPFAQQSSWPHPPSLCNLTVCSMSHRHHPYAIWHYLPYLCHWSLMSSIPMTLFQSFFRDGDICDSVYKCPPSWENALNNVVRIEDIRDQQHIKWGTSGVRDSWSLLHWVRVL